MTSASFWQPGQAPASLFKRRPTTLHAVDLAAVGEAFVAHAQHSQGPNVMNHPHTAPFGSWKSPITSDLIVAETIRLSEPTIDGTDVYWTELRPAQDGRIVLVRQPQGGPPRDVTPPAFNVRTRVHEYGGAAFVVRAGTVWFSNFGDQRMYRQSAAAGAPHAVTPELDLRFADANLHPSDPFLVCICEDHTETGSEASNRLVVLDTQERRTAGVSAGDVLASRCDFYSSPRISPDGKWIAWLQWNHPNMPWDGTELCLAAWSDRRPLPDVRRIAGGPQESILQPMWSPDGTLYFISDRSDWWNLYRWTGDSAVAIFPKDAEFATPPWVFGNSSYGFESANSLLCVHNEGGRANLTRIDTHTQACTDLPTDYTSIADLQVAADRAIFIGGSPALPSAVVELDLQSGSSRVLRQSASVKVDGGYLATPQAIEFPTEGECTAHAFYYPPTNADYVGPQDARPPLLVRSHGGPTSAASTSFNLGIQYWTSRGFAFLDVNYGGSTGYGREYRNRLRGNWGVVDVDDCINAAKHLIRLGLADKNRTAIDGGSAGGYTTLCALTMRDFFAAGASHFGLSDLEVFVGDTHKFESRYLESLVGPWPEARDLYAARSPINFVDRLSCPIAFFQGDEDKIVPPNQAEIMVEVLRNKGLPVAYVLFEGEQHGFRKAANMKRALDGEFYFFAQVFGFEPGESLEPLEIENLA